MNRYMEQAAADSQQGGIQYVVYVPDQGLDVFTQRHMEVRADCVFVEAIFMHGQLIALAATTHGELPCMPSNTNEHDHL